MAANQNGKVLSHSDHSQILIQDPQFFKVVTFPSDMGLKIPDAFMRKYGRDLKNAVLLKVPSRGAPSWKVELVNHHENGTLLQKGWQEFAEYYSIEKFYFLVFRYQGNSQFLVLIFDPSAVEIEYSGDIVEEFSSRVSGENHGNENRKEDDVSVEILDNFSQFKPSRKSYMGTRKPSVSTTPISNYEQAKALKFSEPFFITRIRPSFLSHSMEIPKKFVRECMSMEDEERHSFVFCVTGKMRSWAVTASAHHTHTATGRKRFHGIGWKKFVKDNGLMVGDVCVFELVDPRRKFNITVYRSQG